MQGRCNKKSFLNRETVTALHKFSLGVLGLGSSCHHLIEEQRELMSRISHTKILI
jgi:hypothetical protein